MNAERCPYSGSVSGDNCRKGEALEAIKRQFGDGILLSQLRDAYCKGSPLGCPAYDSISVEGHNSPWRK